MMNVPRVLCSLLHSCLLFIYLRARKRGFNHDPSGMALSHGGLGPVSRIGVEDGEGTAGSTRWCDPVPPTHQTPGLPKQTLLDGEEGGEGHDRDNEVRK